MGDNLSRDEFKSLRDDLQELKTGQAVAAVNMANLQESVRSVDTKLDERLTKVETTIFGDDEKQVIGVVERLRTIEHDSKKLMAGAVIACTILIEAIKAGAVSLWLHLTH